MQVREYSVLCSTEESRSYERAGCAENVTSRWDCIEGWKFQVREYDSEIDILNNLFNFSFQICIKYLEMSNNNTDNSEEQNVAENTNKDQDLALLRQHTGDQ